MKISILTFGTRGDVEPLLALSIGLRASGHEVILAAPNGYSTWIEANGVQHHPMRFDMMEFMRQPEVKKALYGKDILRMMRVLREGLYQGTLLSLDDYWEASQDADFVLQVGHAMGGVEIAQFRNIPLALGFLWPFEPTRAFPSFMVPYRGSLGSGYNLLTHALVSQRSWGTYGRALNDWRQTRQGLSPWRSYKDLLSLPRRRGAPFLNAISPLVLPKPVDWGPHHHMTGHWLLDTLSSWTPDQELKDFLAIGDRPVFIGFGSMGGTDPQALSDLVIRALALTGHRGIISVGGGGGLQRIPATKNIMYVQNVPYSWLFPQMAAVVHHGGPGTMAIGLHAGVPNILVPHLIDHFGWADRLAQLGVGLSPCSAKKLTAEKLANAIDKATSDPALLSRVAAIAERIRAENGVKNAVEIIERHAEAFRKAG